jgi:hypothetical protein
MAREPLSGAPTWSPRHDRRSPPLPASAGLRFRRSRPGTPAVDDRIEEDPTMTEPEQPAHTAEPAEGAETPGDRPGGQTPHPDEPAEGQDTGGGADSPDA